MSTTPPRKCPRGQWNTPKRKEIQVLRIHSQMRWSEISKTTGVPESSVRRICTFKTSRQARPTRTGRPRILQDRDLRRLVREVCKSEDGRKASYMKLARDLGIQASEDTIRRAFHKLGFHRYVACPKPFINWRNRQKRLQFAREHVKWTIEDWKKVIWTDESSFETGRKARTFVTRRPEEKHCPDCLAKHMHSGQSTVMVWGAISGYWTSPLVRIKATMKYKRGKKVATIGTTDYIDQVLQPVVGPGYRQLVRRRKRPILMEDNAAIHTANLAQEWRRKRRIRSLIWPPSSPDLNPDENMWRAMKQRIKRYPTTITKQDDMWEVAKEEWDALCQSNMHLKYIESLPERMKEVIKHDGFAIRW